MDIWKDRDEKNELNSQYCKLISLGLIKQMFDKIY